jgi:hypothetical protein
MTYNDIAKKYLTPPVYRRWVENTSVVMRSSDKVEIDEVKLLSGLFSCTFIWEGTTEGDSYWRKLSRELNEKIKQGILRVSD